MKEILHPLHAGKRFLLCVALCLPALLSQAQTEARIPTADQGGAAQMPDTIAPIYAPFDMPQLTKPVFPDYSITIKKKSVKKGQLATTAIQTAIDEVCKRGGGTVIIPEGVWNTGRIILKSNVNLHLDEGAELHFSGDVKDYLPVVFTRSAGIEGMSLGSFIYANGQENIAVTGRGRMIGPERDCQILKQNIGYGDFDKYIAYDKPGIRRKRVSFVKCRITVIAFIASSVINNIAGIISRNRVFNFFLSIIFDRNFSTATIRARKSISF